MTARAKDAALRALGCKLETHWACERAYFARPDPDEAEGLAHIARTDHVVSLILKTHARTLDGLLVKARAIEWCHSGEIDAGDVADQIEQAVFTDTQLLWSIFGDIAAMRKAAQRRQG